MAEINVICEKPITAVELKERLMNISKRGIELKDKAAKVKGYLDALVDVKLQKMEELKKKIGELNISRLKERHIVKIIDIMPQDMDSLKVLFIGENITVKQEDMQKILDSIK